ncbi:MAG TPA: GNAT family protein [Armatimonadota bacterium]|jgi:RimJ/RimL family protein N-acetyltransferase
MSIHVPESFETARLLIRAPQPGDGPELNAAVRETFAELRPWMPWADHLPSVADSEHNIQEAWEAFQARTDLRLNLYLKETGAFVGGSGLHRIDWSVPKFEIGYWRRRGYEGRGLVTEAVLGIAGLAFNTLGAQRVEIRCDTRNERSRAVALRAGFRLEGIHRRDSRAVNGEIRDTVVYAMLPEEYQALPVATATGPSAG